MIAVTVSVTDLGLASELNAGGCRLLAYVTCSKFIWYYHSFNQSIKSILLFIYGAVRHK